MKIIAVDDERPAVGNISALLKQTVPEAEILGFTEVEKAFDYLVNNQVDIAFLDIEMGAYNGISLAKECKMRCPQLNIIFVTGYTQYTMDALKLHASGYLLKPVCTEDLRTELENLRHPVSASSAYRMRVRTFGDFEVYVDQEPLHFSSAKAKELFALLIDRQGARLTTPQIAAVLWEEEPYTTYQKNWVQQVIVQLRTVLQKVGCAEVLYKERNQTAVKPDKLYCDYYEFLKGNVQSINSFAGEYMAQYSWAEFTTAFLNDNY